MLCNSYLIQIIADVLQSLQPDFPKVMKPYNQQCAYFGSVCEPVPGFSWIHTYHKCWPESDILQWTGQPATAVDNNIATARRQIWSFHPSKLRFNADRCSCKYEVWLVNLFYALSWNLVGKPVDCSLLNRFHVCRHCLTMYTIGHNLRFTPRNGLQFSSQSYLGGLPIQLPTDIDLLKRIWTSLALIDL